MIRAISCLAVVLAIALSLHEFPGQGAAERLAAAQIVQQPDIVQQPKIISGEKIVEQPKTVPAGAGSWVAQRSGVNEDLFSVAFVNDQVGVACGANYTILRTTDGGNSWKSVMGPKDKPAQRLASVIFANDKVGYVRDSLTSALFRTGDAGASWQELKTPNSGTVYSPTGATNHAVVGDLYFWQNSGSAFGGNCLYVTNNAGASWTKLWETDGTLGGGGVSLDFTSPTEGWMASVAKSIPNRYFVGRTSDGGKTWSKTEIKDKEGPRGNFMLVQALGKDHVWFTGDLSFHVFASTDAGATWAPYELGNGDNSTIPALQFLDAKIGYILCGHVWHVRQTADGGKTWNSLGKIGPTASDGVRGMTFTPSGVGYAVGAKGFIAKYQAK